MIIYKDGFVLARWTNHHDFQYVQLIKENEHYFLDYSGKIIKCGCNGDRNSKCIDNITILTFDEVFTLKFTGNKHKEAVILSLFPEEL